MQTHKGPAKHPSVPCEHSMIDRPSNGLHTSPDVAAKATSVRRYATLDLAWYTLSFLADRTNGRAIGSVLRLSLSVCNVVYCG